MPFKSICGTPSGIATSSPPTATILSPAINTRPLAIGSEPVIVMRKPSTNAKVGLSAATFGVGAGCCVAVCCGAGSCGAVSRARELCNKKNGRTTTTEKNANRFFENALFVGRAILQILCERTDFVESRASRRPFTELRERRFNGENAKKESRKQYSREEFAFKVFCLWGESSRHCQDSHNRFLSQRTGIPKPPKIFTGFTRDRSCV